MAATSVDQKVALWDWKRVAPRAAATDVRWAARSADAMVLTSAVSLERWSVAETVVTSVAVMETPLAVAMVVATAALSVAQMVGRTVWTLVIHWAEPMGIPMAGRRAAPLVLSMDTATAERKAVHLEPKTADPTDWDLAGPRVDCWESMWVWMTVKRSVPSTVETTAYS